jgi:hypothetical protein
MSNTIEEVRIGNFAARTTAKIVILCLMAISIVSARQAWGAENGTGVYLLGFNGPYAAILPPPGVFFQNDFYLYQGGVSGSKPLPLGINVTLDAKVTTPIDLPTFLWSTPWTVLGGRVAFSISEPIGGPRIDADVTLGPIAAPRSDSVSTFGDPLLGGKIGWDAGDFHWTSNALVNVPVGDYDPSALANISFHHWALDLSEGGTYFNTRSGLEASVVAGFTLNAENPATDYRTGTEFHAEWSLTQAFGKAFSAGLVGYYYDQVAPDSGSGARLGDFEGRVAALGGTAAYMFNVGEIPVSTRIKVYREFDVANRAEGTAGFLTLTVPLYVMK